MISFNLYQIVKLPSLYHREQIIQLHSALFFLQELGVEKT